MADKLLQNPREHALELASRTGRYAWRPGADTLEWSPGLVAIYGLMAPPSAEEGFTKLVHPDDRTRVEGETSSFLSSGAETYDHRFRIIRPDGQIREIIDRGVIERDARGDVLALRGLNIDVTPDRPRHSPDIAGAGGDVRDELGELEALYRDAPVGLALFDRDLRFLRINQVLADINGFSVEAHLGRTAWDLLPDLQESAEVAMRRVLETGVPLRNIPVTGETPAQPGVKREWCEHFYPVRDREGRIFGLAVLCEEVTEQRRAEAALRDSEERLRRASEAAGFGVHEFDPALQETYWSDGMYQILGLPKQAQVFFADAISTLHPDDRDRIRARMEEIQRREGPYEIECRIRRPDGEVRWVQDRGAATGPVDPDTGLVARVTGTLLDITARKAAEDQQRRIGDAFSSMIARSPFGIYLVDADFRLAVVSRGALPAFGDTRPLIGRDFAQVLTCLWGDSAAEYIARFRHTLETGEAYHEARTVNQRADRDRVEIYDWSIERIIGPDGRAAALCHFHDVTDRESNERKAEAVMEEAPHRIKNLLSLVHSVARMTEADDLDDFHRRFGDRIQALAASQDILLASHSQRADLEALVRSQLLHFRDLIDDRIILSGPSLGLSASAAQTLGMALHELATNAVKYGALSTDTGKVVIDWEVTAFAEEPHLTLSWRESGGPTVRKPSRSGFGQKVSQSIVSGSFGGAVNVDYAATGLVWSLTCPLRSVTSAVDHKSQQAEGCDVSVTRHQAQPPQHDRAAHGVLIVEDEAIVAAELAETLKRHGFDVIGPAGTVDRALKLIDDQLPRFAILDIHLDDGTSERVAERLTEQGVPFLVSSACDSPAHPAAFGGCPFLKKPVHLPSLMLEIERAHGGMGEASTAQ
jgi:PAS domain S-box-containing protein